MPLVLRGRLAWAHDWVSNPALGAVFQTLPGSNFTVNGAAPPANSALTTAAAELHFNANWTAIAKFDGEFGAGLQTYAGTGTLKILLVDGQPRAAAWRSVVSRLQTRVVARGRRLGRRSRRRGGSVGRARARQRDCRLNHGEQHRPARRQRYAAADRLAGRQVVAGGIGRCRRLRRGNRRCARRRIIRGVAARRANGRRCVGVRVGPDNIARRGCRRVGAIGGDLRGACRYRRPLSERGAGAAGVWAGAAVGIGCAAAIFAARRRNCRYWCGRRLSGRRILRWRLQHRGLLDIQKQRARLGGAGIGQPSRRCGRLGLLGDGRRRGDRRQRQSTRYRPAGSRSFAGRSAPWAARHRCGPSS